MRSTLNGPFFPHVTCDIVEINNSLLCHEDGCMQFAIILQLLHVLSSKFPEDLSGQRIIEMTNYHMWSYLRDLDWLAII